jgi:hypothetical protein
VPVTRLHEIADIVVEILRDRPLGRASIADLIDEIPRRVTLSPEDLAIDQRLPNVSGDATLLIVGVTGLATGATGASGAPLLPICPPRLTVLLATCASLLTPFHPGGLGLSI